MEMLIHFRHPRQYQIYQALITTLILCFSSTFSKRALMVSSLCIVPIFYLDMTAHTPQRAAVINLLRYKNATDKPDIAVVPFKQFEDYIDSLIRRAFSTCTV